MPEEISRDHSPSPISSEVYRYSAVAVEFAARRRQELRQLVIPDVPAELTEKSTTPSHEPSPVKPLHNPDISSMGMD